MSDEKEVNYLVCTTWERRPPDGMVRSVKRLCSKCNVAICVDAANAERIEKGEFDAQYVCLHCVMKEASPEQILKSRGMIGGKDMDFEKATSEIKSIINNFGRDDN